MATTDKIIQELIDGINDALDNVHESKYTLSMRIYQARHAIVWKHTAYRFWSHFCKKEINLCQPTVNRYLTIATRIKKLGYSETECHTIISALGWCRFGDALVDCKRKLKVKSFIEKYKTFTGTYGGMPTKKAVDEKAYHFALPIDVANKLDGYLEHFGMQVTKSGNRLNLTKAMQALIDVQLD